MIRHQSCRLAFEGVPDPHRLERLIAEALQAKPIRWAIVGVEDDHLVIEAAVLA